MKNNAFSNFPAGRRLVAGFLGLLLCASGVRAEAHKPVAPLSPAELLKALPAPPEGWKLVESNARNSFATWLISMATREYTYTPPPAPGTDPQDPVNQPQTTKIIISDGGYTPSSVAAFRDFQPVKEKTYEKLMFAGHPAIKYAAKEGHPDRIMFLIKDRFLVTIETRNQKPKALEEWLGRFNLPMLTSIPESDLKELWSPVTMVIVDEINHANSRSYQLQFNYGPQ